MTWKHPHESWFNPKTAKISTNAFPMPLLQKYSSQIYNVSTISDSKTTDACNETGKMTDSMHVHKKWSCSMFYARAPLTLPLKVFIYIVFDLVSIN